MRTARYPEGRWELGSVFYLDLMSEKLKCVCEMSVFMIIIHNFITLAPFKSQDLSVDVYGRLNTQKCLFWKSAY